MRIIRIIKRRVHSLLHRSSSDAELQGEIEIHIQQLTNEAIAAGMTEAEARAAALREFGPLEQINEKCRDTRGVSWIQDLAQDFLYGVRMLRQSPGFTVVAVVTLALGIGANTAIFSIVDAVLLRSLPYPDPDQLVLMFNVPEKRPDALSSISYRDFTECRDQNQVFSEMAGNAFHDLTLTGAGEPFIVNAARRDAGDICSAERKAFGGSASTAAPTRLSILSELPGPPPEPPNGRDAHLSGAYRKHRLLLRFDMVAYLAIKHVRECGIPHERNGGKKPKCA
jgi:hypothetical protein